MKVYRTYRDFINNPWVIIGIGVAATFGYLFDSIFFDTTENVKRLSYISSLASFLTLLYYILSRSHKYTVLKILTLILWVNLLVAPFIIFGFANYEFFYLRNSLFYLSLLPIVALLFGTREYLSASVLFFIQFSVITYFSNNSFLTDSFVTICILLGIYTFIIYAFIISINDYLEYQEETQKKMKAQSKALIQSNSTKGKLLSIIGHDLRSPLMSLTSLSVLIDDEIKEYNNNELKELFSILNTTIDQTAFLVNNLLEWSRTQENQITLDIRAIRIEPFLNSLKDLHSFSLNNKNIDFKIGPINSVEIIADQNALQTILRNIVTNSIKFTPINGEVSISTKSDENGAYLTVSDSGVGMTDETIKNLLDIEIYSSKKGTNFENGSGIGFNLCNELMQLHNGTIKIESALNKGTSITLFFPRAVLGANLSE